jgi:hypothetical protein
MRNIRVLLFLISLLIVAAPAVNYAQVIKSKKKPKKEDTRAKRDTATYSGGEGLSTHPDPKAEKAKDSLFITLERTPCFGHCPSYKIEIYYKGYAVYHGYNYVDRIGTYWTVISRDKLKQLFDYAKEIRYFNFKESYINPSISDFPTTITSMQVRGERKTVVDGHNETPSELIFFEKMIDDAFKDAQWKPLKEKKPEGEPQIIK